MVLNTGLFINCGKVTAEVDIDIYISEIKTPPCKVILKSREIVAVVVVL